MQRAVLVLLTQIEVFQAGWNRWKPQGNGAWGACVAQETRLAGGAARCFSAEAAAAETPPVRSCF